jgi:3-oxoacyl-[acyl-carrier protein] reductase
MNGRTVLVTGGASGTGATTTRELHRLGAEVVIGTRRPDRYTAMADELGGCRVHPFIVDITDGDAVENEIARLAAQGIRLTDLVHCAAGGLEPIMRRFMRQLAAIRRMPASDRGAAVEQLRRDLRVWLVDARGFADRVNYLAPRALTKWLVPMLPDGAHIMFYSSLWSSFYGQATIPAFYHTVAASKLAFERWLEASAPEWAQRGISTTIVSGHIIRDTHLGEVIDGYLIPLLPRTAQDRARSFFIDSIDMTRAAIAGLCTGQEEETTGRARWLYVFGPGQVVGGLAADAAPLAEGTPLADPTVHE